MKCWNSKPILLSLERLKFDLAEYREVAEKTDDEYRKFSPTLCPSYQSSGLIEFELGQEVAPLSESLFLGKLFSKKIIKHVFVFSECALIRKKRL